jgi:subfamily B ATP-binding cassette protein MsbA
MIILGILLLQSACVYAAEVLSAKLAYSVEVESMLQVLRKLLQLEMRFFDRHSQGDVVMSSYYDMKGIRSVTMEIGKAILYLARLAGLGVVAWLMSPKLAVVGLLTIPVGALPAYWFGQRITQAAKRERSAITSLYDIFLQLLAGIRVIKISRGEERFLARANEIGHEIDRQIVHQARSRGLARLLLESVSGIGLILVLTIGGRDVAAGTLQWQSLLGLLIAVMAVYAPVVGLLQMYGTIRSVIPNLQGVDQILDAPIAIADKPDARPLAGAPREIALEEVSFAYGDQPVLHSVSARFSKGETIGIVGPSGTGKSTLMSLLLRFYDPTGGRILFDRVDLRDIRHGDLMDRCAIVLQEPFVFMDTVANNIRMGRPDASLEEVAAAAKAADIHDEILQMESGYDTLLGGGQDRRGVSVGQKQRLCIAAALLKNAPLLFLDEATSNLDSVSERRVQAAIERLMAGRTTFVIAHRLSTLRRADRILVLDEGRIAGLGTHEELLRGCATYRDLWAHQFGGGAESTDEPVPATGANG